MNLNFQIYRFIFPSVLLLALLITARQFEPRAESAKPEKQSVELVNYDIRTDTQAVNKFVIRADKSFETPAPDKKSANEAESKRRGKPDSLNIEFSEILNIPEVISPEISSNNSFLTQPDNSEKTEILRKFLRRNFVLFGLDETQISDLKSSANYTNPDGNLSFVHLAQRIKEIPVFQGEVKAGFTKRGEIIRIINNLAPNINAANVGEDFGNPQYAVINAAKYIRISANEDDTKIVGSNDLKFTFEQGQFSDQTTSEKIYFPIASGVIRPAWRVILWTNEAAFYLIVDAETGTLLWRKNITENQTQPAVYSVYGNTTSVIKTADNPIPFTPGCADPNNCPQIPLVNRQSFSLIGNELPYSFNNLGWISDAETRTIGNNAEAGIDRDGTQGIDPNGWAFGNPNRMFGYNYNPVPGNPPPGEEPLPQPQTYPPSAFQQGSVTNAFYAVNRWHDETYLLGFTESARNYQTNNFGRGGVGNDSISVEVQDGSGTNGANFTTPPDGGRPRLQLFVWTGSAPSRDGALDNQIVIHEATHGLSSRLHGNSSGLSSNMARGMGEGWSDFYALSLLSEPTDNLFGTYSIGCYSVLGISGFNCYYGIRRFPIAVKRSVGANNLAYNPLTFKNINAGNCSVFNSAFPPNSSASTPCDQTFFIGEIWSSALWEVRANLIEKHGATEGNRRALQYITDGMKLSPINPTMLQSRDSILIAVSASNPNDLREVWRGFAVRGMGISASIQNIGSGSNNTIVTEAFNLPNSLLGTKRADFDNDGKTDLSVFRPIDGNWYFNNNSGFSAIKWGISGDIPVPSDYDGDGRTDLGIFRPETDSNLLDFYILRSSNFTFIGYSWGLPGDIPVIEDYDGDGKSDISVFRPATNTFYVLQSSNSNVLTFSRIASGFRPIAGDFDGDQKGDFVVFGNGQWRISKSTDNYQSGEIVFWGLDSDKLVPADFDGDGIDDIAVFRPSNSVWYIRKSSGGNSFIQFGNSTDIPVPGDYDGDGIDDIGVYRNGIWYINQSTSGILISQFGLSNDLPIPNQYLH